MKTLLSIPADLLPAELQVLREVLWACWESDVLPREAWLNQIRVRACPEPAKAFEELLGAGVLVRVGEGFRLNPEA